MSEKIRRIFAESMEQALREEKLRADKLKAGTQTIPVAHIFCRCGELLREQLVKSLLTASPQSFDKFKAFFFQLNESHEKTIIMTKIAKVEKRHIEIVLLEHLAKIQPTITLQHLIDGLKEAHLFRVIASIDTQSIQALSNHTSSHSGLGCCSVHTSSAVPVWVGVPRLSDTKSPLPSSDRIGLVSSKPIKTSRGIILLTFMEDGRNHAKKLKEVLEEPKGKSRRSFKVYTLSDFTQRIMEDFMKNILWLISQVDFVVPVLSEDYIHMLDDEGAANSSSIDEKFAPYVARLLLAEWASSFKNKRLRCFKPKNVQWPSNKLIYPPFLTAVNDPSALPSILKTSKRSLCH